jgi:hypothetical protein
MWTSQDLRLGGFLGGFIEVVSGEGTLERRSEHDERRGRVSRRQEAEMGQQWKEKIAIKSNLVRVELMQTC